MTLSRAFYDFIEKIASQRNPWGIVESFKEAFGSSGTSSSLSWAWSDLDNAMRRAEENAPLFIEAFYNVCVECADNGLAVPDVSLINRTLAEHGAAYRIEPPHLIATNPQARPIPVPDATPSLEAEARALIEESLKESHRPLDEGKGRQAVSEILWLLESVATVFRGTGTAQGKYFNKIIGEMKTGNRGKAQEQEPILDWMTKLHGYLPQKIRASLSMQRGENVFAETAGVRFYDYFEAFSGTVWLSQMLKLDVIRQEANPIGGGMKVPASTPLRCVTRVRGVELLSETAERNWLPLRVDLDVQGVGWWQRDLRVYMPTKEQMKKRERIMKEQPPAITGPVAR